LVVLVEDDDTISRGVVRALEHDGYEVLRFDRGEPAVTLLAKRKPDLVILDIMLPGMDGFGVLRAVKDNDSSIPVILLTAKGGESDRVRGLDAGADDYVAKPFSIRELLARVRARLRDIEKRQSQSHLVPVGASVVDLRRRVITRDGVESRLTTHEAGVLEYLVNNKGENVTREDLLEKVWGYSPSMQTRTVDNQILKLRKKLEDSPADPRHILTVHGVGYRFET
jgi:DNA-binding response OmpR family regulator